MTFVFFAMKPSSRTLALSERTMVTSALRGPSSNLPPSPTLPVALITTNQFMEHCRRPSIHITALPTDITHEILRSCASTTELFAVIRSCKQIYAVWKGHPNTILRTVVCNQLDMDEEVFPVAFGAVLHWERARYYGSQPVKALLTDDELSPTRLHHVRRLNLTVYHNIVKRLEKEFSKRYAFERHRLHRQTDYLMQHEK
jgi:hypothetical protein